MLLMLAGVGWWVVTTDGTRLSLGLRPTTLLFGGILLALAAAVSLFVSTQRLMMLLITIVLATTAVVWVMRVLAR